ncbi:MAG: ATP-binding protein [Myxococcota bacterium]|nr:ATP-binding protein [Myxococcota bacterium]
MTTASENLDAELSSEATEVISPTEAAEPGIDPISLLGAYCRRSLDAAAFLIQAHLSPDDEHAQSRLAWTRRQLALESQECIARGAEPPEQRFKAVFDCNELELSVLWLAALPWIESKYRALVAEAQGHPSMSFVNLELCERLLCTSPQERQVLWLLAHRGRALSRAGVIRLQARDGDPNPMRHELVLSSDSLAMLQGIRQLSQELLLFARWSEPTLNLEGLALSEEVRTVWLPMLRNFWSRPSALREDGLPAAAGLLLCLRGVAGSGRHTALMAVANACNRAVITLEGGHFPGLARSEVAACVQAACREAAFFGELLVIRRADALAASDKALAAILADSLQVFPCAVALILEESSSLHQALAPFIGWKSHFESPRSRELRRQVWERHWFAHLGEEGSASELERIDARYALSPQHVSTALRCAALLCEQQEGALKLEERRIDQAARNQIDMDLGELAMPVRAERGLGELVLGEELMQRLIDIIEAARNRERVLHEWHLGRSIRSGLGLCCLFDGDPGTGKTLAAEVVATELGLHLMRINTSQLFDKYIGETEKNLERIFKRARPTTHLLLFDEADALFSKRTTVKASNDRYSNMNVGVLLQLVEGYDGVVVLTTNLKQNIDKAFERRIMFKLNFPLPEAPQRERLWQILLPPEVPTAEPIDYEGLSDMELTGGEIKNAVMHAAYTAARQGKLIDMEILFDAAYRSAAESGRLIRSEDWD